MMILNREVAVIVPHTHNDGAPMNRQVNTFVNLVTEAVGGVSSYEVAGAWYEGGRRYDDTGTAHMWSLEAGLGVSSMMKASAILDLVAALLSAGGQISVSVALGGTRYLVEREDLKDFRAHLVDYLAGGDAV